MKGDRSLRLTRYVGYLGISIGLALMGLPAQAQQSLFTQQEAAQSNFVAVAAPYGGGTAHQLMVIEQLRNSQACWGETRGPGPTVIEPLLVNFDFTGICGRSLDSNGYSIRMGGEDLAMRYAIRIIRTNDDMALMGIPNRPELPVLDLGHTQGLSSGFTKIQLNPGWRFTRRSYQGKSLGHVYLTHDSPITAMVSPTVIPAATPMESTAPIQPPKEIIFSAPLPVPLSSPLPPAR
jgi:hypothetical protein